MEGQGKARQGEARQAEPDGHPTTGGATPHGRQKKAVKNFFIIFLNSKEV